MFQGGMRVLHVYAGPFPSPQGTQVYLSGLLGALADRGHHVALRCWHGGVGEPPAGVEVRRLRAQPGGERLVSGPHASRVGLAWSLWRALARDLREPWDVVHAHHVEAPVLARLVRARPVVHHLHTCLAEELPTYGVRGGAVLGAVLDRACARAAHATVAISERGAQLARAWGAQPVFCLPPGIEALSGRADRGRARFDLPELPWVAYVGNLDGYQDLDHWLEQAAKASFPLLVVTPDDPAGVLSRARALGVKQVAIAQAAVFQEQCDALAAAAVAVVPRRRCAGVPMKLLTTLALGLPTVVVRGAVDPLPGMVAAPEGGLAEAVAALLADPIRRDRLSAEAMWGLADHRWSARAAELEACYALIRSQVTPT